MKRSARLVLIMIAAALVPAVIVTQAKRGNWFSPGPAVSLSEMTTKLPISRATHKSVNAGNASLQSKPNPAYSERMGKGREEAATYPDNVSEMSSMGRIAYLQAFLREHVGKGGKGINGKNGGGCLSDDIDCEHEGGVGLNDKQSEMGIAVDPSGLNVVIGFNEAQGFSTNPNKLSGFATSHDGGVNFTVTGVMPSPANQNIGATLYPQIFGDPDIKWIPTAVTAQTPNGGVFVYASIEVHTIAGPTGTGTVQTLCIHRSTDFGDTWTGPFEVTPATNPNGAFSGNNARDAADKELIDVDPDTGRLMVAWSNFTSTTFAPTFGKQMFTTFSDDIATAAVPTWSARQNVNLAGTIPGQGIIPRFAGNGSPNVYVTYQSQTTGLAAQEFFARSTDNGVSFSPAVALTAATFKVMDYVLGNDRSHDFPWMDVDRSTGANQGNIYIVYADNTLNDGADTVFQKSIDGGLNFTAPVRLNARAGLDRPQWFPVVTVDSSTGRIWVFYYDQGVADSGDAMETSAVYSDNGGVSWSNQISLSDRPFHAGYGNDTGQPNLGDYNAGVAQGGTLYSTFAYCPNVVLFPDGQPAGTFPALDAFFKKTSETPARAGLEIRNPLPSGVTMVSKSGFTAEVTIPLTNITTNPLDAPVTYTGINATLTTSTPNVSVTTGSSAYPNIASGATANNTTTYVLQFSGGFVYGTKIDFSLNVTTAQGNRTLLFSANSGRVAVRTALLTENFDGAVAPALPAGWTASHAGGANTVPWKTDNHKPKDNSIVSQGLFHANANDGVGGTGNPTRFERAFSPLFVVPAASTFVEVDFDITYDTEDDPSFVYQAYDGVLLRITDQTAGRTLRSVLTETFADIQQTGNILHYPKHFPRNSSTSYFEDMSAWAGDSSVVPGNNTGVLHVHMMFPGMGGSTAQLRFEFAQDSGGICTDVRPTDVNCGLLVDNLVVNNITYNAPTAASTAISGQVLTPDGQPLGGVAMELNGSGFAKTITDSQGNYSFRNLNAGGFYTVLPSLTTFRFSPAQRSFSAVGNVTDATFTAARDAIVVGSVVDSPDYFVRQHYLDFLNREPDNEGYNFWSNQIIECGNDHSCTERRTINVSAAFFLSIEFQETGSYIYRLYEAAFGRQLSYAEFSQDRQQIISGETLEGTRERYVEQFVERPEFLSKFGTTSSPESFVDSLLQSVKQSSGVDLSSERNRLVEKYNLIYDKREKRPEVLKDVISAAAFKQAVFNQSFVVMEYFGYLRRDPDATGQQFWLNKLNQFNGNFEQAEMVKAFITSGEYRHRFGL